MACLQHGPAFAARLDPSKTLQIHILNFWKVETESSFVVKDSSDGSQLLVAKETSTWCARNPCLCCHCTCSYSSRRPFTLTLMEDEGSPLVLEMSRPLASDCLPCCLQSTLVRDQTHHLGSVNQVAAYILDPGRKMCSWQVLGFTPPFNSFEARDADGDVQFVIQVPCFLNTSCCTQASSLGIV